MPGATSPKEMGKICFGRDLSKTPYLNRINLQWLIEAYNQSEDKSQFFINQGFTRHAGTEKLQQQIIEGWSEADIRRSWKADIETFLAIRQRYLLYP